MTRHTLDHLTAEERRRRLLDQARDAKRRRRALRKELVATTGPLCGYGRTKLCIFPARESGLCRHHERMTQRQVNP